MRVAVREKATEAKENDRIRETARRIVGSKESIANNAEVVKVKDGAWVQAWIWVADQR